jgi:serine/threonine-protein kinase RsbW
MYYCGKGDSGRAAMVDLSGQEGARRVVLASLADLPEVEGHLESWMRVLGFPRKDLFAVKLALEEAVVNAFRHGTRGEPGKAVRVTYLVTLAEVFVEVTDDGAGFDPARVPDPTVPGTASRVTPRGLFLMRVYMTGVSFNRQGNQVTLWRRRSDA